MLRCSFLTRATATAITEVCLFNGECSLHRTPDNVGLLTLNRPERKNALGHTLVKDIYECLRHCRDPAHHIRCIVIESKVKGVFCAGADLKERRQSTVEEAREFLNNLHNTFNALEDLPQPTISAVDGAALGGGCELALCTDIRIAGAGARVGLPETGLGIIPGAGGTFRAPRLMGLSRALQIIITAESISAERARVFGLVNEIVPAGTASAAALAMATRIAKNAPLAIIAAKKAVREGYGKTREEALELERAQSHALHNTEDRNEGLRAFGEKRPPKYQGK